MLKKYFLIFFSVWISSLNAQNQQNTKQIEIIYAGTLTLDAEKYPDATIFNSDKQKRVQFRHQGLDVWCDIAVLHQKQNLVKAYGNVFLQQGDSLKMNSNYIEYDGNTKIAIAKEQVVLKNDEMTLETEELFFDRNTQEAYYLNYGKITDKENILHSKEGRYFVIPKKNRFVTQVKVSNPQFELNSSILDYYHDNGHAYMFGESTIIGSEYKIFTQKGFYNTHAEQGYFTKKPIIHYNEKIIKGDSLFFDNQRKFSSAHKNIQIIDTINSVRIKGHYAEVFKENDSMFITKKALIISKVENDSLYIHGKKILVTGKQNERVVRAFPNARMFKTDMQGKCDSIHSSQKTGLTNLIGKPVIWSGKTQMTGDTIQIKANTFTEKLDTLKVFNNAFVIEKDTIGDGFNQIKGKILYGKFDKNKLKSIDLQQNTEVIYYAYDEQGTLVGINKTKCSRIKVNLDQQQQMETITFYTNVDGEIYPEDKISKEDRKFKDFIWREQEMILRKEDIFSEDEKNE